MTKEEREEILKNYCVKVTSSLDVNKLNELEKDSDEIQNDHKGTWVWNSDIAWYYGLENGYSRSDDVVTWGHVFNSVDEFEAFLKGDPAPSETKFKVGDKVKIVANKTSHSFGVGDIVEITHIGDNPGRYVAIHSIGLTQVISNECAELYKEPEQNPKGLGYGENECILVNNITHFNEICKITGINEDAKYMGNITSGEDTCIYIYENNFSWTFPNAAEDGGFNIIPAQDFIEAHSKEVVGHEKPLLKGEYKSVRKWHTDKLLDRRFGNTLKAQGDGMKGVNTKYLEVWDENHLNKLTCKPKEKPLDLSTRRIRKHEL